MGGDHGLPVTIPAVLAFLTQCPQHRAILVGLEPQVASALGAQRVPDAVKGRIEIVPADEVVTMDDPPAVALRSKRRSSMRIAIEQVQEGRAQAAVSAGNTGALMAIARYVLKTLEGIDRPAIATALPNRKGGYHHVGSWCECRLHGRAPRAVRAHGVCLGVGDRES